MSRHELRCPFCRVVLETSETDLSTKPPTDESVAAIQRLIERDPSWAKVAVKVALTNSLPNRDEQFIAIDKMYRGELSYAEMRAIAG